MRRVRSLLPRIRLLLAASLRSILAVVGIRGRWSQVTGRADGFVEDRRMPGLGAEPGLFQPCGKCGKVGAQGARKLLIGCAYGNPHLAAVLGQAHIYALLALVKLELDLPRWRSRGCGT